MSCSPAQLVSKEQLLRDADLLSLHLPLNMETRHVIDESALVRALQEKRLSGAALDVFEVEPLPATSPLRVMEQVTLTPHHAASSQDAMQHLHRTVADSVEALLHGFSPPFVINHTVVPRVALRPWKDFRPCR